MHQTETLRAVKSLVDTIDNRGRDMPMDEIRQHLAGMLAAAKEADALGAANPVFIILHTNQLNYEVNHECQVTHFGAPAKAPEESGAE